MGKKVFAALKSYAVITLGAAIYALAFAWCYAPNRIGFGGLTGLVQVLNHYLPAIPVGGAVMVANIPLFLLGWKLLGGKVLVGSAYAMVLSSAFIDLFSTLFSFQRLDSPAACALGGVLLGTGLGLVFTQGATTGGTDLMARLLKLRLGWLPVGKLLLVIDLAVIVIVAAAFWSLESGIYGMVALFVSTTVMDKILYGLDTAKVAYIISQKPEALTEAIVRDMGRGVTVLEGRGAWSGQEKKVLLCAFKQRQIVALKAIVKGVDPGAFLIVTNAHEVLGDGFGDYQNDEI